jgi:hypothetical protein
MTFYRYLESLKQDDTAIGDLARDILMDTNIYPSYGIQKIRKYFKQIGASERIMYLLEESYTDFKNN